MSSRAALPTTAGPIGRRDPIRPTSTSARSRTRCSHQRLVETAGRVIVGVNRYTETSQREVEILRVGAEPEEEQVRRLREVRAGPDQAAVDRALAVLRNEAEDTGTLPPPADARGAGRLRDRG